MSAVTDQVSAAMTVNSSGQKPSIFVAKSGFVIPKNKLSGSLVPVFRGDRKAGDGGSYHPDDNVKLLGRKTKWSPDLTLDPAVRKGRALAYQIRVDQISEQLKSGILHFSENDENPSSAADRILDLEHPDHKEKVRSLELERREIIGEMLRINPITYKPPADYKPVLKEARVPVTLTSHVIGVIFGSDTVKRLEKETGAKVQLYGTGGEADEPGVLIPAAAAAHENTYKDVYFHVLADSFEKVDAAVSLITLLLTPVHGNTSNSSAAEAEKESPPVQHDSGPSDVNPPVDAPSCPDPPPQPVIPSVPPPPHRPPPDWTAPFGFSPTVPLPAPVFSPMVNRQRHPVPAPPQISCSPSSNFTFHPRHGAVPQPRFPPPHPLPPPPFVHPRFRNLTMNFMWGPRPEHRHPAYYSHNVYPPSNYRLPPPPFYSGPPRPVLPSPVPYQPTTPRSPLPTSPNSARLQVVRHPFSADKDPEYEDLMASVGVK